MERVREIGGDEVLEWLVAEGILEVGKDFSCDGDLFVAGLDSMAVMQLVVAAEERFGVELGPADLTRENLSTPRALAGLLAVRQSVRP